MPSRLLLLLWSRALPIRLFAAVAYGFLPSRSLRILHLNFNLLIILLLSFDQLLPPIVSVQALSPLSLHLLILCLTELRRPGPGTGQARETTRPKTILVRVEVLVIFPFFLALQMYIS